MLNQTFITLKTLNEIKGQQQQLGKSTKIVDEALALHKQHGHLTETEAESVGLIIRSE